MIKHTLFDFYHFLQLQRI